MPQHRDFLLLPERAPLREHARIRAWLSPERSAALGAYEECSGARGHDGHIPATLGGARGRQAPRWPRPRRAARSKSDLGAGQELLPPSWWRTTGRGSGSPAPAQQPRGQGAGGRRRGAGTDRGRRASWQVAPTSVLPGEQTRLGCPFASPASPALLPGVPLTPGHPEAALVRFQTNAWKSRARGGGPIEAGWHSSPVTSRLSSTSGCELSWPPAGRQIRRPLLTLLRLPTAFENQVTNFLVAQFLLLCKWVLTASISPSGGEIR